MASRVIRTTVAGVRIDLLTREYPPDVYGGAGVHVENLAAVLRPRADVRVHAFGAPRAEPGAAHVRRRPGDGRRLRGRGRRALAHLVREPRGAPRGPAEQRAARGE